MASHQPAWRPQLLKPVTIIGIVLIVLGIIGFATGGISFTHRKKDVDLGAVQISHKTQDTLPLSPVFSTVSLVAGLALVVVGARSK
jgi:preprotein translocase subunit Sss1